MALSLSGGGNSAEGYMGNGIYVDEVEIKKASDVTEQEKSSGFSRDVSIKLEVLVLNNDWDRTVTIGGNYKKDPNWISMSDGLGYNFNMNNYA